MTTDREMPAPPLPTAPLPTPAPAEPPTAGAGARLAELASRTNLGALDTVLAVATHAGAGPGRNVEAAATTRRVGRRMTTSMAQFRIATTPR